MSSPSLQSPKSVTACLQAPETEGSETATNSCARSLDFSLSCTLAHCPGSLVGRPQQEARHDEGSLRHWSWWCDSQAGWAHLEILREIFHFLSHFWFLPWLSEGKFSKELPRRYLTLKVVFGSLQRAAGENPPLLKYITNLMEKEVDESRKKDEEDVCYKCYDGGNLFVCDSK